MGQPTSQPDTLQLEPKPRLNFWGTFVQSRRDCNTLCTVRGQDWLLLISRAKHEIDSAAEGGSCKKCKTMLQVLRHVEAVAKYANIGHLNECWRTLVLWLNEGLQKLLVVLSPFADRQLCHLQCRGVPLHESYLIVCAVTLAHLLSQCTKTEHTDVMLRAVMSWKPVFLS